MNPYTGEILTDVSEEVIKEAGLVPIDVDQMTEKQQSTKQVSKYDNRSELGKIFTYMRQDRDVTQGNDRVRTPNERARAKAKRKAAKKARKKNRK